MTATIRDLREQKNLSQIKVADAAGLTFSRYVRIEEGSGKTTPDEVAAVLRVLEGMEPGTRKLAGRPFGDPDKQAAVVAARAEGRSVAAALGLSTPLAASGGKAEDPVEEPAEEPQETPLQRKARMARERRAAKKAAAEAGNLL